MALLSIFIISLTLGFSLILASSPLFLGLWILFLALSLSLLLGTLTSSWLGLFMFLIYVGGLLVMFAYFVALAPNQLIEGKTILSLSILSYLTLTPLFFTNTLALNSTFRASHQSSLTALLSSSNTLIYIFLALILFFALVAVVKIRAVTSGPLRPYSH